MGGIHQTISVCFTLITGRNEVVAKVIFLHLFVILFTGGGCLPQCMLGYHTPPGADTPQSRHAPPGADTPLPQADTPPGVDTPGADTPRANTPQADTPWE